MKTQIILAKSTSGPAVWMYYESLGWAVVAVTETGKGYESADPRTKLNTYQVACIISDGTKRPCDHSFEHKLG